MKTKVQKVSCCVCVVDKFIISTECVHVIYFIGEGLIGSHVNG